MNTKIADTSYNDNGDLVIVNGVQVSAEKYAWKGEGPEPAYWYHKDGTKVYRNYEDYCDV